MASTFLALVNKVNQRVNEVELTSATFANAVGFYSLAKQGVNNAIRDINQVEYQWPFNHNTYDETLVAGTTRYAYQADTKTVDMDSFRIQRDAALGNETVKLRHIDYDEYLDRFVDDEYNTATSVRNLPKYVFRTPDQKYGVHPVPDKAYTLTYEYYSLPTDLSASTDTPTLPEAFDHAIVDGAMYYVYFFRGDTETADRLYAKFQRDIDRLREIYINNDSNYMRDTRVDRNGNYYTLRTD